jgi:hypothetical protein
MRDIVNLNPDVIACVGDVRNSATPNYQQEKLLLSMKTQYPERELSPYDIQAASVPASGVAIAPEDKLPPLHAQQREAIDRFVQCALGKIEKNYPLLSGESVEKDYASFLTEPFLKFPAGTAVIKRSTNMADLYYVITNVQVDERGDLLRTEPPGRMPRAGSLDGESLPAKLAMSVVTGMASAVGGAIANFIIGQIFPPGVPSYFDQVYQRMSELIGQGLQQDKIESVNGAINTIKDHVQDEYSVARRQSNLEDDGDRAMLFNLLQKYDSGFISGPGGMLGTLQLERNEQAGFAVFLLGASLQLALFQEMANVAPQKKDGKWLKPLETSYGKPQTGTVAVTAQKFATYADRVWPKVIESRIKNIRAVEYEANKHVVSGDVYWELHGKIDDNGTPMWNRQMNKNNEKDGSNPTRTQLNNDVASYKQQVTSKLIGTYSDPTTIANKWRELIKTPMRVA